MEPIVINCPACSGANEINMNSLPLSSVSEATQFEAKCAMCGTAIPFGYVPNVKVLAESGSGESERVTLNAHSGYGGGDGGHFSHSASPSDQRSNTLNPNNSASRAAGNNHANQMNPNNAAYRASHGRKG